MSTKPPRALSRLTRFLLMGFIALCMVFTSGVAALKVYPGLVLLPVVNNVKTSPYCPVWRSVTDAQVKIIQLDYEKKILAQSHIVRKEGAYKLWSTPAGEYWVTDTSDNILGILLAQQKRKIYGDAATGHVGVYVKTALDAGAEKIVAIEPSPEALECLRRNFAKEIASGKVIVYPKGIWDEEKHLVFYANGNGAAGDSFVTQGANARVIADIAVTTIVKELGLPRVDIIKADIKGAGPA
jgi:FkbM family methyltransferase